jgi:UPF0716 protein FxsA
LRFVRWLVLLFVVLPLADLFFLLEVGSLLGLPATVAVTVVTGVVGAWLVRREGRRVWLAWRQALGELTLPEHGLVEAALVLLGGALLVTPGVMTDLVGIVFILPWSRRWIAGHVRGAIDRRLATGTLRVAVAGSEPVGGVQQPRHTGTVETVGEAVEHVAPER